MKGGIKTDLLIDCFLLVQYEVHHDTKYHAKVASYPLYVYECNKMIDVHGIWHTHLLSHSKDKLQIFVRFGPAVTMKMTFALDLIGIKWYCVWTLIIAASGCTGSFLLTHQILFFAIKLVCSFAFLTVCFVSQFLPKSMTFHRTLR